MYRIDWEAPILDGALRSPHGIDVPLVFDNIEGANFVGNGPEPYRLAELVSQAWINFARTGDPSQKGLVWPRYNTSSRETMIIDLPSKVVSDPDQAIREFWSS